MSEAREVRARARALREQRGALEARLAAGEGDAWALRLELARLKEELADCAHRLKELEPRHRVSHGTTWAGVDGWKWDRLQYQTWAELEGAEEPEGPTRHDRMRLAARTARERAVTEKQGEYLSQVEKGRSAAQAAREAGRDPSAVARTVRRGKARIARDAKALFAILEAQERPGPLVLDLAEPAVLGAVLSLLTPRQQLYLYLYYGEWLSLREIGRLLRVDHASVLRSIRCALERLEAVTLGTGVEVRGLEAPGGGPGGPLPRPGAGGGGPAPAQGPGGCRPAPQAHAGPPPAGAGAPPGAGRGGAHRPAGGQPGPDGGAPVGLGEAAVRPGGMGGAGARPGQGKREQAAEAGPPAGEDSAENQGGVDRMLTIIEIAAREDGGHGLRARATAPSAGWRGGSPCRRSWWTPPGPAGATVI